ncbi:tail fiber domain-containing protein, partial [Patescibacteria group bacterium]|nr:tail fiber domain-containing protein [Patescibacteria group bacterium]
MVIRLSYAAWSEPSVVPPGNNTNPPLDTSSTSQNKTGALTVGSTTNFTATGMYAPIYYDSDNTNYYLDPSAGSYVDYGLYASENGSNWFGIEADQTDSVPHGAIVNSGVMRLLQFQLSSPYKAGFVGSLLVGSSNTELAPTPFGVPTNGIWSAGGLVTAGTAATEYGASPEIVANGDNHSGGGIAISDDGGFFDYNDGYITYNGSTGIRIAGNNGPSSTGGALLVTGNIIPSTVNNTGGGTWVFGSGAWGGDGNANTDTTSATGIGYSGGSGSQLFTLSSAPGQMSLQMDGSTFVGDNGSEYNPFGANGSSDGYLVVDNSGSFGGSLAVNNSIGIGTSNTPDALTINGLGPSPSYSQLRMIYGNYGAMWRNDGGNTYFLLTNSGDQYGGWNTLRPFTINDATGQVSIGQLYNTTFYYSDSSQGYDTSVWNCTACTSNGTYLILGTGTTGAQWLTSNSSFGYPASGSSVTIQFYGILPDTTTAPTEGSYVGFGWGDYWFVTHWETMQTAISVCGRAIDTGASGACASASTSTWEDLGTDYGSGAPVHTYKIVITSTTATFYVDGVQVGPVMSHSVSGSAQLQGMTWDAADYSNSTLDLNWVSVQQGSINPQVLTVGNSGDGSYAVANAWNTFSDRRFKTNINPIPPTTALQDVLSLQGVTFNWIKDNQPSIGFIAQDVQKIVPQIVSADQQGYLSVDYSKITPILVQAIKEQEK